MKTDSNLLHQKEMAAHFGVSTNAFRAWGLPSVRRDGRTLLYDPGVAVYARLGQRVAEARKIDVSGPLREFALGFVSSREVGGQLTPADVKAFIKFSRCAGFEHDAALIVLGDIARLLGAGVQAG